MATRALHLLLGLATLLGVLGLGCQSAPPTPAARSAAPEAISDAPYIRWLVERSMLHQAELTARRYSGQGQPRSREQDRSEVSSYCDFRQ
jgi:hypothetical protein